MPRTSGESKLGTFFQYPPEKLGRENEKKLPHLTFHFLLLILDIFAVCAAL